MLSLALDHNPALNPAFANCNCPQPVRTTVSGQGAWELPHRQQARCDAGKQIGFNCVAAAVTTQKLTDPPPHVSGYEQDLPGR